MVIVTMPSIIMIAIVVGVSLFILGAVFGHFSAVKWYKSEIKDMEYISVLRKYIDFYENLEKKPTCGPGIEDPDEITDIPEFDMDDEDILI